MKKAFTLIELLIVVLIIGILASIALPQYEKAVLKTRATEIKTFVSSLEKAMDLHILDRGYILYDHVSLNSLSPDMSSYCKTIDASKLCTAETFSTNEPIVYADSWTLIIYPNEDIFGSGQLYIQKKASGANTFACKAYSKKTKWLCDMLKQEDPKWILLVDIKE